MCDSDWLAALNAVGVMLAVPRGDGGNGNGGTGAVGAGSSGIGVISADVGAVMSSGVGAVNDGSAAAGVMVEVSSYSAVESSGWSSRAGIDSTLPSAAARN